LADRLTLFLRQTNYNLLTIRHEDNKFENSAGLALHETITKLQRGAFGDCRQCATQLNLLTVSGSLVSVQESLCIQPELVFATSSGRLGIIGDLNEGEAKILRELQLNMESLVTGPEIPWSRYREIHAEGNAKPRPPLGFIDGDL
jgi:DNA damage-binding protein 1